MIKSLKKIKETKPVRLIRAAEKETRKTIATLMLGGFGLVAALAWNDAIQSLISAVFPKKSGLVGKFVYAIIITIIIVFLSSQLKKISSEEKN
jgi:predicted lysophospholipase L1 biosynthesis ABC-type transport system permease subunit